MTHGNRCASASTAKIMITDQLKLGADVAYLPYVEFNGTDNHLLRIPLSYRQSRASEIGVQLESILSYLITDQFSIGRWRALLGHVDDERMQLLNTAGAPCPCQTLPAKTERYGVFVQLDYKGIGSPLEGFK